MEDEVAMIGNRERLFWGALAAALLLSLLGLLPRLSAERSARSVALVVDYRDLLSLARENGETPEKMARRIGPRGIVGVLAAELSGKDLALGKLPLRFEPASAFGLGGIASDRGVIALPAASPLVPRLLEDLKAKFPDLATRTEGKTLFLLLPAAFDELGDSGLVPDYAALDFARKTGWVALYRPSPCVGVDGARTAAFLTGLFDDYPQIRALVPAGMVIAGYPDLAPVAEAMRQAGICAAQVEFVKQIGAAEFARETAPDVLPLHSLVRDEILSRRMTREQIVDRMVRAVFERSIRVVILRPYELYSGGRAAAFEADLAEIAGALGRRGYRFEWPLPYPGFGAPLSGALACGILLIACAWMTASRFRGKEAAPLAPRAAAILGGAALVCGVSAALLSPAAKLLGAAVTVAVATEACLTALDPRRRPLAGATLGLVVTCAGGLSVASFFGHPLYMLRLAVFSGVKATLLLPPLLVLLHDLRRGIHPEPLGAWMRRPPLWAEGIAALGLLAAVAVVALRSDNVSYVPDWEIAFRDMLERFLVVRPRTKEFLFGYPCLMLARAFAECDLLPRWRELFRLGAALAFASAVNSFCHFHTLLVLTLVRVVNGWWIGILFGALLALAVRRWADSGRCRPSSLSS